MADYSQSKQQFASDMQNISRQLLTLAALLDNLNASYSVHGFNTGGANAFNDTDFASQNQWLTASIVSDTMFAVGSIVSAMTPGIRNSLRECLLGGLP